MGPLFRGPLNCPFKGIHEPLNRPDSDERTPIELDSAKISGPFPSNKVALGWEAKEYISLEGPRTIVKVYFANHTLFSFSHIAFIFSLKLQ